MDGLVTFKNVDIYLLDQVFKNRINKEAGILDAGCGSGRNFIPFFENGFDITGIDPDKERLSSITDQLKNKELPLFNTSIENFISPKQYGFIICNAVLHFAESHEHFDAQLDKLIDLLDENGILFIRMTSNIGLEEKLGYGNNGVYDLPDGTTRYLLSRQKVDIITNQYQLKLLDPVKTVFVDGQRSMTTLVLSKQ